MLKARRFLRKSALMVSLMAQAMECMLTGISPRWKAKPIIMIFA